MYQAKLSGNSGMNWKRHLVRCEYALWIAFIYFCSSIHGILLSSYLLCNNESQMKDEMFSIFGKYIRE